MIKIFRTSDNKILRTSANKILRYNVPDITYANSKYGLLYNWYAVTDARNIAPVGWHVPTKAEYDSLATYLGGASIAGSKLKETGIVYWDSPNSSATNEVGFNARAGGTRTYNTGGFSGLPSYLYLWTTSTYSVYGYRTSISSISNYLSTNNLEEKKQGNSVRLIKDDSTDTGTMVGTDGLTYRTVKIGSQVWMAENYQSKKYRDGSDIPNVTDNTTWAGLTTGAWCAYDNNLNNV